MNTLKSTAFLLLLLAGITTTSVAAEALDQTSFNKAMESYLKSDQGKEQLGETVQTYFAEQQKNALLEQAKAEDKKMEDQFKNPIKLSVDNAPTKGPADAKVTILEFSDFECPYCNRGASTVDQVLKAYPNDVRVAFKNLPLSFHKNAKPAAIAALAAGKQNKFWEMHDKLFANQRGLNAKNYLKWAEEIGLDMDKFKKDLTDPALAKQIEDDMAQARKAGISGTPGFLVNGVLLVGAQPLPKFKAIIDRHLGK